MGWSVLLCYIVKNVDGKQKKVSGVGTSFKSIREKIPANFGETTAL